MITAGYFEPWVLWVVAAEASTSMSSSPNPYEPAIKHGYELARIRIDVVDGANITVVDLLFVVVLDLHHLVGGSKRPTKPLDLAIAGGIECGLQLDVQRPCAGAAAVHRT